MRRILPTSGHTPNDMVVHHAGGLHERITNRGTDEGESALLERLAHRVRLGSGRGDAVAWLQPVDHRRAAHKLPDEPVETATFLVQPLMVLAMYRIERSSRSVSSCVVADTSIRQSLHNLPSDIRNLSSLGR